MFALSAGGSAAPGQSGYAVSGSVSLNEIANTTEAFINSIQATIDGDISLDAKDTSKIFAIAGAASYGGKGGFGAAIAINNISGNTRASLDNSTLNHTGKLEIAATGENDIQAISASAGLSLGQESKLGGAGTVSVNKINSQIQASISNTLQGSTNPTGLLSVTAKDKSSIQSLAGAVGISKKVGFGAAVAYNRISGDTKAFITQSNLSTESDVSIQAETNRTIQALSLGVGGGKNLGLAGSVSLNKISGSTEAVIDNNSNITAKGKIELSATVSGAIGVISGGVAGSVASGDSALSGSGAASVAINTINSSIIAAIASSTIQAGTQNTISIIATDTSTINAFSGGGALLSSSSGSGGTLSIGVSVAKNEIDNTTKAYIEGSKVSSSDNTDVNLNIQALTGSTISTQSVALAVSIAKGEQTKVSISGGGAAASNVILTKTNAYVKDSNLTDRIGNVAIKANNTSAIDAIVIAISGSVTIGAQTGVAVALGAAVANNFIGYDESNNRQPSEVQAYIQNSSLNASGNLTLNAIANETITARVGAGSVAVAASKGTNLSGSGSGVSTENKIATLVKAFIDGDGATGIQAKTATLTAEDSSTITADAGAASIAVAVGQKGAVALSIGVALASNLISNEVEASIKNADNSVTTTTGDVSLSATTKGSISAVSVAASVAVGVDPSQLGAALSGAGAASINTILSKTNAYIAGSVVNSARAVNLIAKNEGAIAATVAAVSAAVGVGGEAGLAASIGAAVANNFIGYDNGNRQPAEVQAYIQNSSLTASGDLKLSAIANETITAEVKSGSAAVAGGGEVGLAASGSGVSTENKIATLVKAFIDGDGATGIQAKTATLTAKDSSNITADAGAASLAGSFGGTGGISLSIGVALASNLISNEVEASSKNADYFLKTNTGDILLSATSDTKIQAVSVAASLAASFGGTVGIAISGAGAAATNTILTKTNAYIKDSVVTSAGAVTLTATNTATIDATIVAASVALGGGGTAGGAVSIGAAVANNFIGYNGNTRQPAEVQAYIQNSSLSASRDLMLSAIDGATINAKVGSGSAAISGGGTVGGAASGSGVSTENKIAILAKAFIDGDGATGIQAKSATLIAKDSSKITADAGAASLSVAGSGTASIAGSVGVALAHNVVTNEVQAFIQNADNLLKTTTGDVLLSATTDATIKAVSVAASLAAGVSGTLGIGISGAGAESTNTISTKTNAYIKDSVIDSIGAVKVDAKNTAEIIATVIAASVALGVSGTAGGAASIGVAIARNQIGWDLDLTDTNYKYTTGSGEQSLDGKLTLNRGDRVLIKEGARAGDIYEFTGDPASIDLKSADYAKTSDWKQVNLKQNAAEVLAYVNRSSINAGGSLSLTSLSSSTIASVVESASVAVSGGIGGASLSGVGVSTENKIATKVQAYIDGDGSTGITSSNVTLTATDTSSITANAEAASIAATLAIGVAISVGVSLARNEIANDVRAFVQNVNNGLTATVGDIQLTAKETSAIETSSVAASAAIALAGISKAGAEAINTITNAAKTYIFNAVQVQAQGTVALTSLDSSTIQALAGQISAGTTAGLGVSVTTNNISNEIIAEINNSKVTALSGDINLSATETGTTTKDKEGQLQGNIQSIATGGTAGGLLAAAGAFTVNNLSNTVRANIANGSNVEAQGNVSLSATNTAAIQSLADQKVGAGGAALGAALAVNNSSSKTQAYISDSTVTSSAGQIKAVAEDTGTIVSNSAGASVSGGVALTGSVSVNNITNTTDAHASNVIISAFSDIEISATDKSTIESEAGQISAGIGAAGVGAAVAYNNIANIVTAYVTADDGKFTTIDTSGNAIVSASGRGIIDTIAAGGSLGLFVGAGGSVAVNQMSNNVSASVQKNSSIKAKGSVGILADSTNSMTTTGGTLAGGLVGLGATIAVNNLENTTRAYVNNSSIDGVGEQSITIPKADGTGQTESFQGVAVMATSKDNLGVTIGTGGGAAFTFVASIAVNSFQNTTEAFVNDGAINANLGSSIPQQSVYIKAFNDSTVDVKAGTAGVGLAAAAGVGIDITTMKNATTAYINSTDLINSQGSVVNAQKDLVVEAKTQKLLTSNVVAFGGGLGFSVQGAVSIINVSSGMSDDGNKAASDTQSKVDQQLIDLNKMGKDSNGKSNITTKAVSNSLPNFQGTTAFIAGTVGAGSNIIVNAYETTKLNVSVTGASAGLLGAGAGIGIANITHNASAYVGANSNINAFNVTIQSTGFVDSTKVTAKAGAAGGLALGAAVAYLTSNNNSKAYIGEKAKVNINGPSEVVNVIANSVSKLATDGQGVAVGALAVGVVLTKTEETGATSAYLDQGVRVQNTNNLNVTANVDESVTATATAAGGGIISGNGVDVRANVKPNVTAYIGGNNTINVVKDINVRSNVTVDGDAAAKGASYGALAVGLAFSEVNSNPTINTYVGTNTKIKAGNVTISSSLGKAPISENTSFNPSNAVDNAKDSVKFTNNHGLRTGDTVVYSNGGGNNIDGLANQESYTVIVVDDQTVKLGSEFNASTVDTKFNTIKFANGHNFTNGQQVIYEAESGKNSIGGLTSGQKYYVKVVDGSTIQLSQTSVIDDTTEGAKLSGISATTIEAKTEQNTGNVFQNGETVTYKKRSALFSVDKELPNTGGKPSIFNLNTGDIVSKDTINSAGYGFENGDQVIYTASGAALGGLTSGQKYYVKKVDDSKFQLSVTEGGAAIDITSATAGTSHKITAVGLKTVGTSTELEEGVTYYVLNATSTSFQLSETSSGQAIALDQTGLTGTGTNHLFVRQSVIDLTSASTGLHNLHIDLENGTATGTKHLLSSGASIVLPSQGDQVFSAYSQASSGGAIAGSGAKAEINVTPTMNTYVGNGASITATGDVKVQGRSSIQVTGAASTSTGGLVGVGVGKLDANIVNNNKTTIFDNAKINADGNVTIDGKSSHKFNISSDSTAGGLIPIGDATSTLNLTHNTITEIGNQVNITSLRDLLVSSSSDTNGLVKASANGGGLVPFAYGTANINVSGANETKVNSATLEARKLTVESVVENLNVSALGLGKAGGLIGIIQAKSNIDLKDTKAITYIGSGASLKADELNLTAIFRNVNSNSIALAHCDGLGGKTDSDATNYMNLTAKVDTKVNSKLTVNSLNVKSGFDNFNDTTYAHSKKAWSIVIFGFEITLDFGRSKDDDKSIKPQSFTSFDSNVVRLARQVNPLLVIDASGKVSLKSNNVTVSDNGTDINVGDINANGGGKVTFSSGTKSTDGSFTDNGKYSAIDPAFDTVEIQNYSDKNLIINGISTISTSSGSSAPDYSQVNDSLSKTINATTSSSPLSANPTLVTINNWGVSNLILQGVIDNPHDRTILYSGGNIFSQGTAQNIITRDLTITALDSSIGANGQRITAQLNQGYTPVTSDVTDNNIYLNVEAQNSIYLDLTAKSLDNQPATVNMQKMTASTGEVNLAIGQTTNQANTSISALYKFTDAFNQNMVAGTNIVINAGTTTTNIDAKTLFLGTTGLLDVVT